MKDSEVLPGSTGDAFDMIIAAIIVRVLWLLT